MEWELTLPRALPHFRGLVDPLQRQRCVLGAAFYLNSFLLRSLDFRKSTYSETREVVGEEQPGITDDPDLLVKLPGTISCLFIRGNHF